MSLVPPPHKSHTCCHCQGYTPFIADLLRPTAWGYPQFGKLLFALGDLAAAALIESLLRLRSLPSRAALRWALVGWLLNPLSINLSTRGSADSLGVVLVLAAIHVALAGAKPARDDSGGGGGVGSGVTAEFPPPPPSVGLGRALLAGGLLGLAAHLRLYPIIYTPAFALALVPPPPGGGGGCLPGGRLAQWAHGALELATRLLAPPSLAVLTGVALGFGGAGGVSYARYGDGFLQHALLYHAARADHRHNYSPHFLWQYLLGAGAGAGAAGPADLARALGVLPLALQAALLAQCSIALAHRDLPLCLFVQTLLFVAGNKVCTAQYFVWWLPLAPLVLPWVASPMAALVAPITAWVATMLHWLFQAWSLEMKGRPVFLRLWGASLLFYLANASLACAVLRSYAGPNANLFDTRQAAAKVR